MCRCEEVYPKLVSGRQSNIDTLHKLPKIIKSGRIKTVASGQSLKQ